MFQFPRSPSVFPRMPQYDLRRIAPFGDLWIIGCSPLPTAFRSVPRPSSAVGAKASTTCPLSLAPLLSPHACLHHLRVQSLFGPRSSLLVASLFGTCRHPQASTSQYPRGVHAPPWHLLLHPAHRLPDQHFRVRRPQAACLNPLLLLMCTAVLRAGRELYQLHVPLSNAVFVLDPGQHVPHRGPVEAPLNCGRPKGLPRVCQH